jgi:hypothetical protein
MKRYCKHSKLDYIGMLAVQDEGYRAEFMNDEKAGQARQFANRIASRLSKA